MYIRDRASGVHRPGHQLQLLLSVLLLLSLALPQAIASRSRRSSSRRSAGAFVVAAPSSAPTPPAYCRRWSSITTTIVMQAQVSSSIMDGRLPPAPFVVYLTPGVPEAAAGAPALEAWYRKVSRPLLDDILATFMIDLIRQHYHYRSRSARPRAWRSCSCGTSGWPPRCVCPKRDDGSSRPWIVH